MNSTLSSYLLSSVFMLVMLGMLVFRAASAIKQKNSRSCCLILIVACALYVIADFVFILCHLSGGARLGTWKVVAFIFYIIYVLLPFAWHLFVRNFVGKNFNPTLRKLELIPLFGAVINNVVIPVGTIFPFQPFCSVVVAMSAFFFIATKDSEMIQEQQQKIVQDALEKAENASQVKTRFLSDMSHDIRTPMNAIINLVDLALAENDVDTIHEYLHKMKISGNFLLGLIDDILDVSRIESGAIVLHKENLTRTEFLNTIETVIHPLVESKKLNFHQELNPGEYTIAVDKLRFNQVFFNLLSNAVKFTPEGGDVWLEVHNLEVENNRLKIRFVVRDNGIGMSEEFQKNMFRPFAREDTEANRKTQGTGLGLTIVKGLVDAMDGTISVKSKLGEGTEIDVTFYVDIVARGELKEDKKDISSEYNLSGKHILLVEDNELNTYVAKVILEKAECIVDTAENGQAGLDKYMQASPNTYDAILMDVRMPVMDGLEATKAIRNSNHEDSKTVPIIAMTADVFEDERGTILGAGMSGFLAKPIEAQKLYKTIYELTSVKKEATND